MPRPGVPARELRRVARRAPGSRGPAWMSTGRRRSSASATSSSTRGCDISKPSARGWSLIPRAPASRQRRASATASCRRGRPGRARTRRPPEAAASASTWSLAAGSRRARASGTPAPRAGPASSSDARISAAVALKPSGSLDPMCVWASNQTVSAGSAATTARRGGGEAGRSSSGASRSSAIQRRRRSIRGDICLTCAPGPRQNQARGPRRPPDRPRRVVPAPRGRRRPHARRRPCWSSRASAPSYDELRRRTSSAGCTSSRATASGSRSCRSARAARCGSTTRTSTPATTSATPRCPRRATEAELKHLAGRVFSQAPGPLQAAVGDLARRAGSSGDRFAIARQDPPRARGRHLRRRHHHRAVRHLARARPDRRAGRAVVPARRCRAAPQLLADALLERADRARRDRARRPRAAARPAQGRLGRARDALVGVGAMALARASAPPPSPLNVRHRAAPALHLGRRATWREFKAIKNALGGTVNDVVLAVGHRRAGALPAPPRRRHRRAGAQGDGPGLGARRRRARRARQPRRRDVGAAAGRRGGPASSASRSCTRRWSDLKESGQAVGAAGADASSPASRRRRSWPRPRACSRASASSTSSSPTCPGPQFPLYLLGRADDRRVYPRCRWPRTRAWASRS